MSSARVFILVKYLTMEEEPYCALAKGIQVLMTRARDWDANIPSVDCKMATAVGSAAICPQGCPKIARRAGS